MGWFDWSRPRGGIAFLAICFILAGAVFTILGGESAYTRYVAPFFLPLGIGLWLKHSWARWVSIVAFVMFTVLLAVVVFNEGFTIRRVLQGVIIASSLYALWDWKVYEWDED